jgi:methyl acetate hydrolase
MFDPGTQWRYGIGLDWTGQIIEALSGMSLGEYFAAELTGPLAMIDTAFDYSPSMFERAASLHPNRFAAGPGNEILPSAAKQ